jgi:hypothetical protein
VWLSFGQVGPSVVMGMFILPQGLNESRQFLQPDSVLPALQYRHYAK